MFTEPVSYQSRTLNAIALIVCGYFFYSVADLCSKILQDRYGVYQVLMVSGGVGMVITGLWITMRYGLRAFFPPNLKAHLYRGLIVLGTAFTMVSALDTLPMADFYGIVFLAPFIVLFLSFVLLKEKVGIQRWLATIVAFTGVLILAGPRFNEFSEGLIYALLGAIFIALNIIALRKIGKAPLPLYGFYPFLFITLFNAAGMIVTESYVPFRAEDAHVFAIHGPVIVLAVIATSLGYARAPETPIVAPFHYTQILWGVLFGWMFFSDLPTASTLTGLALIAGAGLFSIYREYRLSHGKRQPDAV